MIKNYKKEAGQNHKNQEKENFYKELDIELTKILNSMRIIRKKLEMDIKH